MKKLIIFLFLVGAAYGQRTVRMSTQSLWTGTTTIPTGGSLTVSGSGAINATSLAGVLAVNYLRNTSGFTAGVFLYDFSPASSFALPAVHLRSDTSYTMDAGTVITTNLSATQAGIRLTCGTLPSAQISGNLLCNAPGIIGWNNGTDASVIIGMLGSGVAYPTAPASGHNLQWASGYKVVSTNSAIWAVINGGIGVATITGIMQGNGTSAVTGISNSSMVGQVLRVTGAATYAWGALDLADGDAITGIIPAANNTVVVLDGSVSYCADAGANDTYTCSLSPAPAGYVTGARYRFKANTLNTGAASINFNSLGAKTIVKVAGGITTTLATNDILAGQVIELAYDGINMQMQSMVGNAASGSMTVAGAGTEIQYRSDGTTLAALANSSIPNAGEILLSTTPATVATRSVFGLGAALVTGLSAANTGTYLGVNAGSTFIGDYFRFEKDGAMIARLGRDAFDVTNLYLGTNVRITSDNGRTLTFNYLGGGDSYMQVPVQALISAGSAPSVSGCGSVDSGSTLMAGSVTSETTGTCTPVLNFSARYTATTGWSCSISNLTTANLLRQTAKSTTTATFSGTTVSGDVLQYLCVPY